MRWSDRWDQAWDQSLEENLGMHSHTEKSIKAGSNQIDQFRPFNVQHRKILAVTWAQGSSGPRRPRRLESLSPSFPS